MAIATAYMVLAVNRLIDRTDTTIKVNAVSSLRSTFTNFLCFLLFSSVLSYA